MLNDKDLATLKSFAGRVELAGIGCLNDKDLATLKTLAGRIELVSTGCLSIADLDTYRTLRQAQSDSQKIQFANTDWSSQPAEEHGSWCWCH